MRDHLARLAYLVSWIAGPRLRGGRMRDHLARLAYLVSVIASLAAIGFVLGRFG